MATRPRAARPLPHPSLRRPSLALPSSRKGEVDGGTTKDTGTTDEAEPPAAGAALAAVTSIRKPPKPLPLLVMALLVMALLVMALLVMALLLPGRGRPILGRPDGKGPSQAPS